MILDDAPLAGLRIIEVSSFVAAPLGGMTLAQLGAEVIRVDPLGGAPDTTRWPLAPNGGSLYWAGLNKGKRSVTLDPRSPDGQRAGPVNHVLPAWDVACGLYAAIGILAAERHRRRTGAGRAITLSLADVALAVTGHLGFLAEGQLAAATRGDDPPYPAVISRGDGFQARGAPAPRSPWPPYPPQGRPRIGNH